MATLLQNKSLLPANAKSPDSAVRSLSSSSDGMDQVWSWNDTQPTLVYECAHELIKKQVDKQPDAKAVHAHDATFGFQQLDDLSTRLSHLLVEVGVEPEDIVPLCFEKSAWAIVAILGVIKAGAAFVFIDPSHPESRRETMMSQIEAKLVVSSSRQAALWEVSAKTTIIVDRASIEKLAAHDRPPPTHVTPSNLLYVIFTSGSTGIPKACLIEHKAFCSGSVQHAAKANILPSSRVLQLASFVFDVSILEILTSLISGACICLPSTEAMLLGPAHIINNMAITWAFLTPSLVKTIKPSEVPNLRTLALGGEPLSKVDVETWAPNLQLVNGYGPSECSIAATGNTHMTSQTDPANIGWPIGGLCWIVDAEDHNRLVATGDIGELLIEGPILARGYLKNQAKTDAAFINGPAWGPKTKWGKLRRLYKTGDLAKFNIDGSIHFVGRKDTQVKLRGFRIELGEIEHHIANHDYIELKMVTLPKTGLLKERLIAVVTLSEFASTAAGAVSSEICMLPARHKAEANSRISSVRAHLANLVPEYMIPETWVVLETFPLLISGKLNRSLVQKWITEVDEATYSEILDIQYEDDEKEDEATMLESQIRDIYATVLNLPTSQIRLSRSFLSLGGDSITAMQVMSRCRAAGIAITVKDLLRSKSISEVSLCAGLVKKSLYSKEEKPDTAFDLSPVQSMYFQLASEENYGARDTRFNQSFLLRLTRKTSRIDLEAALKAVVQRHPMLRVRFEQAADGRWVQRVLKEVAGAFDFAIHAIKTEKDTAPFMAATQLSLDIRKGPVFAVNLFQKAEEGQLLFLVAHHAMIDLVSWRTILRDLEEYLMTGAIMAEKPIPFQNWLTLQAEHEAQPQDLSMVLPFHVPDPDYQYWGMVGRPNTIGDTLEQRFQLDREATNHLLGDACHAALNTEPIHLLLAALIHSFRKTFTDRLAPALFREGHGREPWDDDIDISETVGWFTTMFPIYAELGEEDDIIQITKRVKDTSHSVPDNGRPYFASRYLNAAGIESFGHHDQVEISFDYLGLYQQLEKPEALLQQVPGYEATAQDVGRDVPRFALIEITAEMILGHMQLSFVFNSHMKNQKGIISWVSECKNSLMSGIENLLGLQREFTLTDFPLLSLTYDGLDEVVNHRLPRIGVRDLQNVETIYPCSPMQNGLLIAQSRYVDGYYEYHHTMRVETKKPGEFVDVSRLQNAWEKVVQRHPSLRTVFIDSIGKDGLYDQLVLKAASPRVKVIECAEGEVATSFNNQESITFQSNEPPHRLTICKSTTGAIFCKLDINHAIVDGGSIDNIIRDLTLAYDDKVSPKPGFPYESYISYILKHPATESLHFWNEHLAGVVPCLLPAMANFEDASCSQKQLKIIDVHIGMSPATLAAFCQEKNVTLVNVFQLAWGLVLRAYTESEDVCFGYLSSGRDAPLDGIEEGVGAFITMLICRLNLQDASCLNAVLDKVAEDYSRSLPNQYCDLANIQHSLNLAGQQLFNTIMSFHRDDASDVSGDSSITIKGIHGHDPTEYALSVDVGVSEKCIETKLGYWTSDFTNQQVVNIGSTFNQALERVMQSITTTVGEVDLVGEDHIRQMQEINRVYPEKTEKCIHDVIQAQIDAHPDEEAICSWEGSWTYRELGDAATKLAHHLVRLGAGPEMIIPYCFPKSAWAIISMVAILKSGAAAVALDPGHPVNRLRGLAEEVDASIILTAPHTTYLFDTFPKVQNVLGVEASFIDELPTVAGPACVTVKPDNASFIVFTSGTTGKPKGIVLEHSAMCTCASAMGPVLNIGPGTRIAQFAAYNFDVSLQDTMTCLQRGGTICVISDYQKMNDLAEGINSTRANWADVTSTVAALLRPEDVPTIRRLNTGGEPLTREVVNTWADSVELYNLYGPAETTINSTCSGRLSKESSANNIGKSYGSSTWVVDQHNVDRLVPVGSIGELIIEGPLLARHYLNEPAKTKAAFIENPAWVRDQWSILSPRRFYKTGDLGSFNPDGTINIVGRRDGQVKINGQRVELDEIMYQVQSRLPDNRQAVVDATHIEEHARSKTIIAYIYAPEYRQSANNPADISIPISDTLSLELNSLQSSLADSLPRYMIPSMYIPVTRVPTTQSGKMDRTLLRKMVLGFSHEQLSHFMLLNAAKLHPTTEMELSIRSLWSQVLDVDADAIGVNHNFFSLGGDSVGAMKLVAAARAKKISISVGDIFASPTLSEMAFVAKSSSLEDQAAAPTKPFSLLKKTSSSLESILTEASEQCRVSKAAIENCYPTTALQDGLMALSTRHTGAYLAQKTFRIPSENFDLLRFQKAWESIIKSQDVLRTKIVHTQNSGSIQVVLNIIDPWSSATDLETYLAEDLQTPVQYGAPLMRLAIVKQANGENYFVWTAHHAVYDGWTVNLLFEAVAKMYTNGSISQPVPYESFIDQMSNVDSAACNSFWQAQLSSRESQATSFPLVPLGYQASSKQSITHSARVSKAADLSITMSMRVRTAWAMVLSTYSDSKDVVFAATLSGRNMPVAGIDKIMGPTIATVPVRIALPATDVLTRQYLKSVQDQSIEMMPYEQIGLQNIRRLSSEAQTAVDQIQNLLVVQPYEASEDVPSFLDMEPLSQPSSNFDTYALVIECNEGKAGQVDIQARFDHSIISEAQMRRMLQQFEHVLQQLSNPGETLLSQLDILGPRDLQAIKNWNHSLPQAIDETIQNQIAKQTLQFPDAPAICAWDGNVTYRQLDTLSSRLAKHLIALGIGLEAKVGLCFDKSKWNVVSMLAILKAGGVCVQLLPTYPGPRMQSILDDIGATVVLVAPQHLALFDGVVDNVVAVHDEMFGLLQEMGDNTELSVVRPNNASFIVFTSGSTGKPKGVVIENGGFCTMTHYQSPRIRLGRQARVLQFASHAFDICLFESFSTLVTGGCVCIPSEAERMNNLAGAINRLGVNWLIMVSTVADTFRPEEVPGIKNVVLGGEPLRADIHARWANSVYLVNDYGPAECSILAVMTESQAETPPSMIGKGLGCRTWVIDKDDHNTLLPIGCIGELLVEGPIVARGYLKDIGKTEAAYINSPTWSKHITPSPTRLYKTGDLVRYDDDGNLYCIGRKDTQIKIRGLRVELGEIEHHIKVSGFRTEHFAVERILQQGDAEKPTLVAFIVPATDDGATMDHEPDSILHPASKALMTSLIQLQDHLSQSLQSYMVPTHYVLLRRMPETQTGKIDRNALRRVGASLSEAQLEECSLSDSELIQHRRAPSTPREIIMQVSWAEVLDVSVGSISAEDNFFKKGGDSIRAMRLVAALRRADLAITVADIFSNAVLCHMAQAAMEVADVHAEMVEAKPFILNPCEYSGGLTDSIKDAALQCEVETDRIEDIYPCTPLQEALITLSLQNDNAYMAQRVFRLPRNMDVKRFKNAWEQLFSIHPILRTRVIPARSSGALQIVLKESISWQEPATLDDYIVVNKALAVGYGKPLTRFAIDAEQRYFIWTAHHALYDGFSANLLFNQLEQIYDGGVLAKPIGYTRFIKHIMDVDASACVSFWRSQLGSGAPTSFPQPPNTTYQPHPNTELERSIQVPRQRNSEIMISTVLRAAWAIVTAQYMDSDDVVFGSTLSGRNAAVEGIETIMAPTITTVPIRIQLDRAQDALEFLANVQARATEMIPYEHTGLQNIHRLVPEAQAALALKNLFVVQNPGGKTAEIDFLPEVHDSTLLQGFHTYAVVMECLIEDEENIRLQAQFDQGVVSEAQMTRLLSQFEYVVSQLTSTTSGMTLGDIDLFSPEDLNQVLNWNNAIELEIVDRCVHDLFRSQVLLRPEAEAVCAWDGSLTYRQLDKLSDKLASYLVGKGVQPEVLVPLCFDKSVWTVVTMMAVLKAGGACVHLGTTQPIARLAQIILDSDAKVLLADPQHSEIFQDLVEVIIVEPEFLESLHSRDPLPMVRPTNPAFVLFTSGSTGKPKGIVVEHGSLCTSSKAHGTNRKVGPHTRLLQFAAYTFDVSVADIFTTLQRGGCICVPSEEERTNDLAGAINRMKANYGFLTPTVAGLLKPTDVPGLRTLVLGGEMLTQDNIQTWAPRVDLIISYGMAECSIHCVDAVPLTVTSNPANLGRSSGCLMWIVQKDNHNKLAPVGCVGELVIEGRMVSRGYLNDKVKTDAAFIEDPTWASPGPKGRRMYKTSDLAKYSDDGEIVYVGRKDFQVKHHGQRIELGEIEHHLLIDSQVRHAVALLPKSGYSQNRLVGVLSLHAFMEPGRPFKDISLVEGTHKSIAELQLSSIRSSLAASVPDYMMPAIWMVVQAIPLTANGKIDRVRTQQWLEEMDEITYEAVMNGIEQDGSEIAATHEEGKMQKILSKILSLPTINLNRSFLDLGGDSIGAMQLKAKCHAEEIEVTVRDVLTCKSISELVLKARFGTAIEADSEETLNIPFDLSIPQRTYLDLNPDYSSSKSRDPLQNHSMLLRLASKLNEYKLARATEAIIQRHLMLRARLTTDDKGSWTQKITTQISESYSFEAHAITERDQMTDIISRSRSTLNITTGPVLALHLFNIGDGAEISSQLLLISVHPLVADMASLHIVVRDLDELLVSKRLSRQKPLSFQTWIGLHEDRAQELREDQISSTDLPSPDFDFWGMKGRVNGFGDNISQSFTLDSKTSSMLLGSSNAALRTQPDDIVLSAITHSFRRTFEEGPTPLIFCTDSGRGSSDTQRKLSETVGPFSTLIPMDISAVENIIDVVGKVKDSRAQTPKCGMLGSSHRRPLELLFHSKIHEEHVGYNNGMLQLESLTHGQISTRDALLEVSTEVIEGEVTIYFTYNSQIHHQNQIKQWIQKSETLMNQVIQDLQDMEPINTLSDFPLLSMNYPQLAQLNVTLSNIGLKPADVAAVLPCSPIQHRMLYSQSQTPGTYQSGTWHAIKAPGGSDPVDAQRLQAAWQKLVNRHEALRTVFIPSITRAGEFDQIVLKKRNSDVQLVLCEDDTVTEVMRNHAAVDYSAAKPHNAFTLFLGSSNSVYCKLDISHALQDGMSTKVIYRDLALAYEDELPSESTDGFREYVSWLHGQDLSPSVDYWKKHLNDLQPSCLPHQVERGLVGRKNSFISIEFPEDLVSKLPQFCRMNGITMATVFQTAWALVLRTYSKSSDIVFGYMTANRDVPIPGIADMVGPLINMLLCRLHVHDGLVVGQMLKDVAVEFLENVEHQYGLVEAIQKDLNDSPQQTWNTVMSLEYGSEEESPDDSPLVFETQGGTRSPEYDVVIGVRISEKKIETQLGYWDNCMTKEYMEGIGKAYVKFLGMILNESGRTLSELD